MFSKTLQKKSKLQYFPDMIGTWGKDEKITPYIDDENI